MMRLEKNGILGLFLELFAKIESSGKIKSKQITLVKEDSQEDLSQDNESCPYQGTFPNGLILESLICIWFWL